MGDRTGIGEPYHPHLIYTLGLTYIAWIGVALYCRRAQRFQAHRCVLLCRFVIALPLLAEVASYVIEELRPGPKTPVGQLLASVHSSVERWLSVDTFLPLHLLLLVVAVLCALLLSSALRQWGNLRQLRRLTRSAAPLSIAHPALDANIQARARDQRPLLPPVGVIDAEQPLAFTTGVRHRRVFVTAGLLRLLDEEEAVAVVYHEWAHVLRRDNTWNWPVRIVCDALWFMPGSSYLWRSLVACQELVCDRTAVELSAQPLALARALVKVARSQRTARVPWCDGPTPAFELRGGALEQRVAQMIRLAEGSAPPAGRLLGVYWVLGVLMALATLPVLLGS